MLERIAATNSRQRTAKELFHQCSGGVLDRSTAKAQKHKAAPPTIPCVTANCDLALGATDTKSITKEARTSTPEEYHAKNRADMDQSPAGELQGLAAESACNNINARKTRKAATVGLDARALCSIALRPVGAREIQAQGKEGGQTQVKTHRP
jgi:hypothetical protein